jgi:ATP-dependent DNA helicase DinG
MLSWTVVQVEGGTLVLFTSYDDLRQCEPFIRESASRAGREVFVQQTAASRSQITRSFKRSGNGVLLGTESFWTGVDVPGRALSHVVIVRIPFDPPNHPVTEARSERLQAEGRSPFLELQLPDALRNFRQGVGRLIRSAQDSGVITILDSRLYNKPYGKSFIACLPVKQVQRFSRKDRESAFRRRAGLGR